MATNTFIVYALTDDELYSSLVNDKLESFVAILNSGKGGSIFKNEFETRDEAEAFGRELALSGHGIPLFAYDKEDALYVEAVERYGQVF